MPLTPPPLDDLDYATVETMLRERIPLVAPDWTDHNDSDPGIALIQLFAHLSEQLGYRLNRVPEKTYLEFLKLVGVRLAPAKAARTRIAFTLSKPANAEAVLVPAHSRITAKAGGDGPPPVFETDRALDVLPAQIAALVTVRDGLFDINGSGDAGPTAADEVAADYIATRYALAWDGKTPKLKDMATKPVRLFMAPEEAEHRVLCIGLAFSQLRSAGFLGARASLHLQIDQDEEPTPEAQVEAGATALSVVNAFAEGPPMVDYDYYRPPRPGEASGSWQPLTVLSDGTDGWTQSGTVRFDVPERIGPAPLTEWQEVETDLAHPFLEAVKTPVRDTPAEAPISGWIRVRFPVPPMIAVRSLSFNTVEAANLETIRAERLGRGTGLPGQALSFTKPNVDAASLRLISRDRTRADEILSWAEVPDFDAAGPEDRVFVLDAEAGVAIFGDGLRGRPPTSTELMIAEIYRHGGGTKGDVDTAAVAQPAGLPNAIEAAFNIVPARGGAEAESLETAKTRAPAAYRRRGRAVTAADFREAAEEAPGVRVARAHVVPLRRPHPGGHQIGGLDAPGLDMATEAPGALSVIVVPQAPGDYPMPTNGELSAVAAHLDTLRLLTTEVHVTTPQYVRLFNMQVAVRAQPGYAETLLRETIMDRLRTRCHVLTGGTDGKGYGFGAALHHADLVAETMRVPGVARVEGLDCLVDGRTPDDAERTLEWRIERRLVKRLTNCPAAGVATDVDRIVLLPDEVPFVDPVSLLVSVVGAP
ncbi:putative baseplate assembly protein [Maribius pontilimi]|uniref:Baseplate assembly protein n=1 Tax=Palleronia pontilimi TaxID=1964209 RepID=A0A934MFF0_9RHOB|nr:putative baseplate assembly protein [Palleronia pontilimi]MBJ3764446.1 putative baseplate assembly protein [Palleronia pontilimi]